MKYLLAFLAALAVASGIFLGVQGGPRATLGSGVSPAIIVSARNWSTSVSSTATVVLPANSGRQGAEICNGGTLDAWVTVFNGSTTSTSPTSTVTGYFVTNSGRLLASKACWSLQRDVSLPLGAVWAISSTTAQTISALEFSE